MSGAELIRHIIVDSEGRVSVSEELARMIVMQVANVCAYHGQEGPTIVPMVLSLCAGFSVGAYAPGRDLVPPMQDGMIEGVKIGVRNGMTVNHYFPKLNS